MKTIYMSNGTNDSETTTKATTEAGYWRAAKRAWPWAGMVVLRIRVEDDSITDADPVIYEGKSTLYC
jgi:hypothetical protein